jgi:hypothetical protein
MACNSEVKTCTAASVLDGVYVVSNASVSALRRDTAKQSMYVSLNQTAVMEGVSAKVNSVAEVRNGKTTSKAEISEINVEENGDTEIEADSFKSTVEMESNQVVEVKNDKFSEVNITTVSSEHLTTFLKTNPPTASLPENSTINSAKDCAAMYGHSVVPECQTVLADFDISANSVHSEPRHKQTCNIIQGDAMQVPGLCDTTLSNILPAVCDFGVSASQDVGTDLAVAEMVMTDLEVGLSTVKVKQEKPSGYGDADLSSFTSSVDRLQETEDMKLEPEVIL